MCSYRVDCTLRWRERKAMADREQLQVVALDEPAPNSGRRLQHHGDGDHAHQDQIDRTVIGQQLAQHDIDQHADERPLDGADAADDNHENHDDRPVVDAETGFGRQPQLLQKDQPADEPGARGGHHVDDEFRTEGVDAEAGRRRLRIADRGQRKPVARAQQQVDDRDHQQRAGKRHQVKDRVADCPVRRDLSDDRRREREARTRAKHRDQACGKREDFGHDPGADRKIRAAQPKDDERDGNRHQPRERPGQNQGQIDIHVHCAGHIEKSIGAEADIGLLADGHESGIAGQQIPELRERQVIRHLADEPNVARLAPPWQCHERGKSRRRHKGEDATRRRCAFDPDRLHVSPSCAGTARSGE